MTSPDERLAAFRAGVEAALDETLPRSDRTPDRLHAAMRYATLGGGKRLRAALVYATGDLFGLTPEQLQGPACAVELIHAYSLVHDDLPAMDDDDLRRGKPTTHRVYGDAMAILAGDALQALAFETLLSAPAGHADAGQRLAMGRLLAFASGAAGMVGGQVLDMEAEGRELGLAELEQLHVRKTGALIRASVLLGVLAAGDRGSPHLEALDRYGRAIGLAFQIQDDILDVSGSTQELGKSTGADRLHGKATYPALMGLSEARRHGEAMVDRALESLVGLPGDHSLLAAIAGYIMQRRH